MSLFRNKWFILFALLIPLNLLFGIDRNAMTVSAPYIQHEMGLDYVLMSEVLVISTAVYALLQVPAGWLVQRAGVKWVLITACLVWSGATILASFQHTSNGLFGARILLGIGQAPDWVACILALKLLFRESEREDTNAILLAGLYTGYIASGTFTPYLVENFGWRQSFFGYGIAGIVLAGIIFLCFQGPSREVRPQEGKKDETRARVWTGRVVTNVAQAALFFGLACIMHSFFFVTFPHFASSHFKVTPSGAGKLFSILWAALYGSVLFWGALIKYLRRKGKSEFLRSARGRVFAISLAAVFLAIGLYFDDTWVCMTFFAISMAGLGLCQILTWSYVQTIPGVTGMAAGFVQLAGNAGLALGPVVFEILFRNYGVWIPVCYISILCGIIGALVWILPHVLTKGLKTDPLSADGSM
ncbi:MFS transporter [Paraburkholderia sediminicola]|uniref:MFS transporter n=1 Tax=Paraburkholderia sediminicola TaxID=458836 RepID=UPI0038BA12D1